MNTSIRFGLAVLFLAALACSGLATSNTPVIGNGHVIGETRDVGSFTSVELAGSADVNVLLGDSESVSVSADDNILPLIQTTVTNGKLVISTKSNVNFTSVNRVVVTLAMKSLKRVTLSGSGNMHVAAMAGPDLAIDLPGSGEIIVEGVADHVTISLPGSGNIQCEGLKARSANVALAGSGNISLYASETLDASMPGSGTIRYEGNPAQVTKSITGSGSITP